ncbi:MAG TPA: enoyl-CoA hydratase-related protein [Candidatus Omnitrophota bacterium]|nr:enoyl-CoA hydratase-related protein [Candidatus Omnitrophota bacterium]
MGQFVKVSREDSVGVILIDNPPLNILTAVVMEELAQAVSDLDGAADVKAVIVIGQGSQVFMAGADIKEIAKIDAAEKGEALALKGQAVLNRIENSGKVFIAAINGVCLGGGTELAMACHLRIASDRAKIAQPEILLGIIPGFGGSQRLPRIVGPMKARELLLTGDNITAQEALRIGLINKVVPDGEVLKQAMGIAKKIAGKSRRAVEMLQEALREGGKLPLADALKLEARLFGKISETADCKEGVRAFLEKRQPKFADR